MILISHRGNLNGKNLDRENDPDYIDEAIEAGYNVEVDIWLVDDVLMLGHDSPTYQIDINWLRNRTGSLWIHCKNLTALQYLVNLPLIHCFWHESDQVTLTSQNYIWAYPNVRVDGAIFVLPELHDTSIEGCGGVCSDFIGNYI
jgi:hypothetical protein